MRVLGGARGNAPLLSGSISGGGHAQALRIPGTFVCSLIPWNDAMVQMTHASRLETYLARKRAFDRRRRKVRLDFDTLFGFFAADASGAQIARRAHVSKERINFIFNRYFSDLFGMTALERRRRSERRSRDDAVRRLAHAIRKERVLAAIRNSAENARPKRTIAPVIGKKRDVTRFRHKAVLVDARSVESVHHIRTVRFSRRGTIAYACTTLQRTTLERLKRTIFVINVPHYPRRIIRCRSDKLLKRLFSAGQERVSVYIPLAAAPENPRYDFLADENNWN
jgi:hypothetical protein